jgi:hypothetical protein
MGKVEEHRIEDLLMGMARHYVGSRFKVRKDNMSSLDAEYPDGGFMRG